MKKASAGLDDIKIHVKVKMAALWASVMFCYICGDYFGSPPRVAPRAQQ